MPITINFSVNPQTPHTLFKYLELRLFVLKSMFRCYRLRPIFGREFIFYCRVFCRESERVPAHRVDYIIAAHPKGEVQNS